MPYLTVGRNRVSATIEDEGKNYLLKFGFNEVIKDEVKMMEGARWIPESKAWRVKNSHRNRFALDYLQGKPVFQRYDSELVEFSPNRPSLYQHQCMGVSHFITRRQCILAAEMGTGKSLMSIEFLEYLKRLLGSFEAWFVAPKVALLSVKMDYAKWKAGYYPQFFTLQEMVKACTNWPTGKIPPRVVIFDEASRLKSPDAKQSQCALHLANAIRDYWGDEGYVILMSGSPAPKSPCDWWHLCEIARPGFLREGTPRKFLDRVALVKKMVGETGVAWPKIITFKDNTKKCNTCGRFDNHEVHKVDSLRHELTYVAGSEIDQQLHKFVPMENEVEKMYSRLDGLVKVILKKDCLDLPEKVYRRIKLTPTRYMMNMAKMVKTTARSPAHALNLLRQLSDGFQYHEKLVGTERCPYCDEDGKMSVEGERVVCIHCAGKKENKKYQVETVECDTPKVQALTDILEEKEEDGRIVIFASYQGAVDRVGATCIKAGWRVIRRDGRGWWSDLGTIDPATLLRQFQREEACEDEKIAIIGHPKSMGMGVTLTASDTIVYYCNSFDAEDRIQSQDRIHRPGCRGANIIDLCHLPVDEYVLDMLDRKINLQAITMGDIDKVFELAA